MSFGSSSIYKTHGGGTMMRTLMLLVAVSQQFVQEITLICDLSERRMHLSAKVPVPHSFSLSTCQAMSC